MPTVEAYALAPAPTAVLAPAIVALANALAEVPTTSAYALAETPTAAA